MMGEEVMLFRDILNEPFEITGYPWLKENGDFNRIPNRIMGELEDQLQWVARQPSGGMIRFKTNSRRLSIDVELLRNESSCTCSQALLSGFDVYIKADIIAGIKADKGMRFVGNICPENNPIQYCVDFPADPEQMDGRMNEFLIYTPLQNPLKSVKVGLEQSALIEKPESFAVQKPILFYGSSITCGFSASRPGLTYPARITRALNANLINLGFGGAAKGEKAIARAIGELDLSCCVIDYDYNAPNKEHLENTHKEFYLEIRKARSDLPIVLISAPFNHKGPEYFWDRRKVIESTYQFALRNGDKNISYINGGEFFAEEEWADFTVDMLHPNDNGFARMAEKILPAITASL